MKEQIAKIIREHFDCGTLMPTGEDKVVAAEILALFNTDYVRMAEQKLPKMPSRLRYPITHQIVNDMLSIDSEGCAYRRVYAGKGESPDQKQEKKPCPECGDSSKFVEIAGCDTCKGQGIKVRRGKIFDCPTCNGTGYTPDDLAGSQNLPGGIE